MDWVVNIASTRALMSEVNTEAYSASKGGLVALTHRWPSASDQASAVKLHFARLDRNRRVEGKGKETQTGPLRG